MKNKNNKKRGVILLIAVLVASASLVIGMGVYNRVYKELVLASFFEQAQSAFSSADTGLECAIYGDTRVPRATSASCGGSLVSGWNPSLNASASFSLTTPVCVSIEITKNAVSPLTTIKARGYNTCVTTDPRRVERGLRIDY